MGKSRSVVVVSVIAGMGLAYWMWRQSQQAAKCPIDVPAARARWLLTQAVPLLRLPTSPVQIPEVLEDGTGLRCPATGRVYPYKNGILYVLDTGQEKTFTQCALDTPFTAWAYDRFRQTITRALSSPDFAIEVAETQQVLQIESGDVVLDLACGQGNFTLEWAKRAGASGVVIGLDYSLAMLARASYHVERWGLDNVLLIHGDAHVLPFADGMLHKVNCSGGFHQFPDLSQALREIARVSAAGAVLTASTFAEGGDDKHATLKRWFKQYFDLHFVPLAAMEAQLGALGYSDYVGAMPGPWFGYASARKM